MKVFNQRRYDSFFIVYVALLAMGCSTKGVQESLSQKTLIESSLSGETLPSWTHDGKVGWEDGANHYLKAQYTIRGDQRINACYDFAKLELKENLITEISADIRGEVNAATEGISENSDPAFNKSFTQGMDANIRGIKIKEQHFERYIIRDIERIDCFVLASISQAEYQNLKNSVLQKFSKSSPEVAQALKAKQVKFFTDGTSEE